MSANVRQSGNFTPGATRWMSWLFAPWWVETTTSERCYMPLAARSRWQMAFNRMMYRAASELAVIEGGSRLDDLR
jgi:hypothetical protein